MTGIQLLTSLIEAGHLAVQPACRGEGPWYKSSGFLIFTGVIMFIPMLGHFALTKYHILFSKKNVCIKVYGNCVIHFAKIYFILLVNISNGTLDPEDDLGLKMLFWVWPILIIIIAPCYFCGTHLCFTCFTAEEGERRDIGERA